MYCLHCSLSECSGLKTIRKQPTVGAYAVIKTQFCGDTNNQDKQLNLQIHGLLHYEVLFSQDPQWQATKNQVNKPLWVTLLHWICSETVVWI